MTEPRVRNAWVVDPEGTITERAYPLDWSARVHNLEAIRNELRDGPYRQGHRG